MLTYRAVPTLYMITYKPRAPTWGDAGADWGFEQFESIPNLSLEVQGSGCGCYSTDLVSSYLERAGLVFINIISLVNIKACWKNL
jgi:hypothetical protein